MKLTINILRQEAINFCKYESTRTHEDLNGITDGKAIGTYIEYKFEEYLKNKYEVTIGSSAKGIDLPDPHINTDIKVTSVTKPQNSSPFKNIDEKIYGLKYNLLIFVYEKTDYNNTCYLDFKHCIFLESERTGDYNLTKALCELNTDNTNEIIEVLKNKNVPGDEETLKNLAKKIISNPPKQGYLTISNAFQWRLRYNNIFNLKNESEGIYDYKNYTEKENEDSQAPLFITDCICKYLKNDLKLTPHIIIDFTCKRGNFLRSSSKIFPETQLYGIDMDENEIDTIEKSITKMNLNDNNIFTLDNPDKNKSILIMGTSPQGINTKLLNKKNSDCSKRIIKKITNTFKNTNLTIALFCNKILSRNIFINLIKHEINYGFIKQLNIKPTNVKMSADACLLVIQFDGTKSTNKICEVSDISNPSKVLYKFGFIEDNFYSDIDNVPKINGKYPIEWKNGIKHDCAKIMELKRENEQFLNKNNQIVPIESTLTYPFLKGSHLNKPIITKTSRFIIVTQKKINQDTQYIKTQAPKTWNYLKNNQEHFDKRKSAIYKNTPNFSIFGVGDYSFRKYKVAISGFTKEPKFSLVYNDKPVMLNDGCYYLSFDNFYEAYITMLILNSQLVKNFLKNIAFLESKRPFSKKILKRIDIRKCLKILSLEDLKKIEKELNIDEIITPEKFLKYKNKYCKPL